MNFAALLLIGLACGGDDPSAATASPEAQVRALIDEYETLFQDFLKANREAKTEADWEAVNNHPGRRPNDYAPRFLALADAYPGTRAAEDALIWICARTIRNKACEEAKRRLVRDHLDSPRLGPALGYQGHHSYYFEASEALFRRLAEASPHREVRGLATYWLARHLARKAVGVRGAKARPAFGIYKGHDMYGEVYGDDWAERLRRLDAEALEQEADALFERVAKFYADIPHNDSRRKPGPLGEAAEAYLHERHDLAIGSVAPDFEAKDLDGRPFRLADYRGKVVVLEFGSYFYCGACREMYPRLRELTERYRDEPLAIISINAEPEKSLDELKAAWEAEGNTWPCLLDGDWEGPIQKVWNIQRFPTFYVLDAEGVIRYKSTQASQSFDETVESLLKQQRE